jgi:simple sugar transport system ATP-binding protein
VVQRERVLENIRRVRDRGVSVVLISHNMPEVPAVADRVEVLRMGRRVAVYNAAQTSVEELVGAMTGALDVSGVANLNLPNGASPDAHPSPDASHSDQRGPDFPAGPATGDQDGSGP